LKNAPFFKLKFSDEERDIIGSDDNTVVIGRSGTGKTTCTILRMFSMETLIKVRSKLYG
jgi:type IV secretory pathway VirB4 component